MKKFAYSLAILGLFFSGESFAYYGSPYCEDIGRECTGTDGGTGSCSSSGSPSQNGGHRGFCAQYFCNSGYTTVPGGTKCAFTGQMAFGGSTCCQCGPTDCGGACMQFNKSYCAGSGSGTGSGDSASCTLLNGSCSGNAYNGSSHHCTCQSGSCDTGYVKEYVYKDNSHFSGSSFYCIGNADACPNGVVLFSKCPSECTECVSCNSSGSTKYVCTACISGYILNSCSNRGGAAICTPYDCGAGKYLDGDSCDVNASCKTCPAGYYCTGRVKLPCSAGTYSVAGASSCTNCLAGTYASGSANTTCTRCQTYREGQTIGMWSNEGSSSCHMCYEGSNYGITHGMCVACDESGCTYANCHEGYTWNPSIRNCQDCSSISLPGNVGICKECEGNTCTFAECPDGYSWNGSACVSSETVENCTAPFVKDESGECCVVPTP